MGPGGGGRRRRRSRSPWSATRPRSSPPGRRPASGSTSSRTRPRPTTRSAATCPAEISLADAVELRAAEPDGLRAPIEAVDGRPRPRDARVPGGRRGRRSTTATTCAPRRRRRASRTPSTTRGSCRRSSGPSSARVAGRSAGPRCPAIRRTSCAPTARSSSCSPMTRACAAGSRWPRRASRSRACRRGSAGSATASGPRPGLAFNELVADRRGQRADRHRPRPPRRRFGRLAQPRDGGDGRRLRRRSPTGRSSTRSSTPRPGRPGSRSTTAAASGSATASTPGWSSSPTARSSRPRSWSAS